MEILTIIMLGILVNVLMVAVFVIFFVSSVMFLVVRGNFELMIWINSLNPKIMLLKEIRSKKSFMVRHHNNIVRLIPYSALLTVTMLAYRMVTLGVVEAINAEIEKERIYLEGVA